MCFCVGLSPPPPLTLHTSSPNSVTDLLCTRPCWVICSALRIWRRKPCAGNYTLPTYREWTTSITHERRSADVQDQSSQTHRQTYGGQRGRDKLRAWGWWAEALWGVKGETKQLCCCNWESPPEGLRNLLIAAPTLKADEGEQDEQVSIQDACELGATLHTWGWCPSPNRGFQGWNKPDLSTLANEVTSFVNWRESLISGDASEIPQEHQ